ncbi:hypothetical protein KFE25_003716 [Diacronema lutheri]|uniref:Fungal lipase-type domain-containing protein n=2 Tax=Diacronema lutheri TaxID=2081491 RepID=A0A8J5XBE3_DIALT|nr:hypothetical protein KFE25_003716 [Diacronema lutheri]
MRAILALCFAATVATGHRALRGAARAPRPLRGARARAVAPAPGPAAPDERPAFDFGRCAELGALAFDAYAPAEGGTWEVGSDGASVGYVCPRLACEVAEAVLRVRPLAVRGLPRSAARGVRDLLSARALRSPPCTLELSVLEGRTMAGADDVNAPARDVQRAHAERRRTGWLPSTAATFGPAPAGARASPPERAAEGGGNGGDGAAVSAAQAATAVAAPAEEGSDDGAYSLLVRFAAPSDRPRLRVSLRAARGPSADPRRPPLGACLLPLSALARDARAAGAPPARFSLPLRYAAPVGPGLLLGGALGLCSLGGAAGAVAGAALGAAGSARVRTAWIELEAELLPLPAAGALDATPDAAAAAARAVGLSAATGTPVTSVTPGVRWVDDLAPSTARFERMAYVDDERTDTQAVLWRDHAARELVLAFRGTEQSRPRDALTDAAIAQVRWPHGGGAAVCLDHDALAPRAQLHSGFERAWAAVSPRVAEIILAATGAGDRVGARRARRAGARDASTHGDGAREWSLYCTGHSLGGALATVAALELAQSEGLPLRHVGVYSFGSPRVGNAELCARVDRAVPEAFRVVNGQDAVPRLPRGAAAALARGALGGILDYAHSGTTVLIRESGEPACEVLERVGARAGGGGGGDGGVSADGGGARADPLELLDSPYPDPLEALERRWARSDANARSAKAEGGGEGDGEGGGEDGVEARAQRARAALRGAIAAGGAAAWAEVRRALRATRTGGSRGSAPAANRARSAFGASAARVADAAGLRRLRTRLRLSDAAALVGIELSASFVEAELQMARALRSGEALSHHLEPSYFAAMSNAAASLRAAPDAVAGGGGGGGERAGVVRAPAEEAE